MVSLDIVPSGHILDVRCQHLIGSLCVCYCFLQFLNVVNLDAVVFQRMRFVVAAHCVFECPSE